MRTHSSQNGYGQVHGHESNQQTQYAGSTVKACSTIRNAFNSVGTICAGKIPKDIYDGYCSTRTWGRTFLQTFR